MNCYILLVQFVTMTCAEMLCDLYQIWDMDLEKHSIYTMPGYYLPQSRGRRIEANVSCPCTGDSCLRKCCLPDDGFTMEKKCKTGEFPDETKLTEIKSASSPYFQMVNMSIIYGSYCISVIKPIDHLKFSDPKDYCVDYFVDEKQFLMLECQPIDYVVLEIPPIYTICLGVSVFFLVATFAVYFFIQNLRNLPGKILLGYVASLLTADIFYMILQVMLITEGTFCLFSAYVIQFFFLASFFWLNVMCFDLWWTFSGYRAFNGLSKAKDRKKFIIYCLYSWGCPGLISIITLIMDNINVPNIIKPQLGKKSCWFGDDTALFYYFYSFISVILIINLILFIHTTIIIIKHSKNRAKFLKGDDSKRHNENEKKRFYVYLKLSSIMGINWLMEILSFYYQEQSIIWDIMDICNTLQGTMIFIIFVCKRRVIVLINKKIYPKKMLIKDNFRSSSIYSGSLRGNVRSNSKTEMSVVRPTENDQSDFVA